MGTFKGSSKGPFEGSLKDLHRQPPFKLRTFGLRVSALGLREVLRSSLVQGRAERLGFGG